MRRTYRRTRKSNPKGVVGIYDNGGTTADRYLVVYEPFDCQGERFFPYTTMSAEPFHPQGVCLHAEARGVRPTGGWGTGQKVIEFTDLPADCQRVVRQDSAEGTP